MRLMPPRSTLVIELAVWVAAALALNSVGYAQLAVAFLVIAVISGTANAVWSTQGR